MNCARTVLGLVVLALVVSTTAHAADFKVIANNQVAASDITAADLKDVFLATKTSFGGASVEPVFAKSGPAHDAFLKEIGKTDSALSAYFRSLVFTGKGSMPKSYASDAEVLDYVAKTKGAIGYVSVSAAAAGVKTLAVK